MAVRACLVPRNRSTINRLERDKIRRGGDSSLALLQEFGCGETAELFMFKRVDEYIPLVVASGWPVLLQASLLGRKKVQWEKGDPLLVSGVDIIIRIDERVLDGKNNRVPSPLPRDTGQQRRWQNATHGKLKVQMTGFGP